MDGTMSNFYIVRFKPHGKYTRPWVFEGETLTEWQEVMGFVAAIVLVVFVAMMSVWMMVHGG
jgi:hypothetical protein